MQKLCCLSCGREAQLLLEFCGNHLHCQAGTVEVPSAESPAAALPRRLPCLSRPAGFPGLWGGGALLTPGVLCPPGMVLVRSENGQLLMIPQQALAQMQAQAHAQAQPQTTMAPRPATPTSAPPVQISTVQVSARARPAPMPVCRCPSPALPLPSPSCASVPTSAQWRLPVRISPGCYGTGLRLKVLRIVGPSKCELRLPGGLSAPRDYVRQPPPSHAQVLTLPGFAP